MDQTKASPNRKARRPRAARACELCRLKKYKCDELYPCTYCKNRNADCVYRGTDPGKGRYIHDYVRHLEEQVKALSSGSNASDRLRTDSSTAGQDPTTSGDLVNALDWQPSDLEIGADPPVTSRPRPSGSQEVAGVNRHTRNVEFYGPSSSVALLSRVRWTGPREGESRDENEAAEDEDDLLSSLHNPAFSPGTVEPPHDGDHGPKVSCPPATHYRQCRGFLENFFTTIHYIHPIIDKSRFLSRCEDLWSGNESAQAPSFMALYYSILSLGALVGIREEEPIDGIGNLQWSRKFFEESRARSSGAGMVTDIDMVQCYFFLAKVCQNELNPHWAYMYVGLAVRTALAIGINRELPPDSNKDPELVKAGSRTWWGLYSLETEMSFAMGRPDTLGADLYHNQHFPFISGDPSAAECGQELLEPPLCAIVKCMVDFSRITRAICLGIYLTDSTMHRTITLAGQIEQDLERWVESIPPDIRPVEGLSQTRTLKGVKDAIYVKRQRLVLTIRYHNLRILLFGSLLLTSSSTERASTAGAYECIQKCVGSAKQTIEMIYQIYQHHDFFRTWFYNTTYTLFAASMLLVYIMQEGNEVEMPSLFKLVEMSVEILETMDECVVAAKAAKMIQRALLRARERSSSGGADRISFETDVSLPFMRYWGSSNLIVGDLDFGFPFQLGDTSAGQPLLDDLGNHLAP